MVKDERNGLQRLAEIFLQLRDCQKLTVCWININIDVHVIDDEIAFSIHAEETPDLVAVN
jgi:hypothetical protein